MRKIYLALTVLGFALPNYFVIKESLASGNIMFWSDLAATFSGMFANNYATAFSVDLLWVVLVFFLWSYHQSVKHGIGKIWLIWLITMLFGLAGGFPLFLYIKERAIIRN
ncbi:MAG: DUF2834 domain-containing protein [Flavobacteriaceae bacterium]